MGSWRFVNLFFKLFFKPSRSQDGLPATGFRDCRCYLMEEFYRHSLLSINRFVPVEDRPMDLTSGLPMDQVEKMFFHNQSEWIRREIVSTGNRDLPGLLGAVVQAPYGSLAAGSPRLMDGLSRLAVRSGDYLYLPGGHWRPATCLPRWKVKGNPFVSIFQFLFHRLIYRFCRDGSKPLLLKHCICVNSNLSSELIQYVTVKSLL